MIRAAVSNARRLGRVAVSWSQRRIHSEASSQVLHSAQSMPAAPMPQEIPSIGANPSDDSEIRWRFPVDDRTEEKIIQVHNKIVSQTCILTLNALTPITHELMKEALTILYTKVESLRICFRLRGSQLWVADMPQDVLDFKSVDGSDLEKEHSELTNSSFDLHNGPLWKARLMTSPEDAPCQFPEVKAKLPYQYDLLLSLHHAANDGVVVMLITELLLGIIDHLLQGLPIDRQQVGELRDGKEVREEEKRIKAALEKDPARLTAALQEYEKDKHMPLLFEAFGSRSEAVTPSTYVLPPILLDKDVMNKISQKCRSTGVTLNAFMTAVFNTSLVELVRSAGLKRDNYSITSLHPVNARRFMEKGLVPYLGFHGIQMNLNIATPYNVKDRFWEYAKILDTEFRKKLKENWMCQERVLNHMLRPQGYTYEAHYAHPLPVCYDHLFSSLYSPENYTQGIGKSVQITSVINKSVFHNGSFPVANALFGLRGQARLEMGYSTASVSTEVGRRCCDTNLAVLHDVYSALI